MKKGVPRNFAKFTRKHPSQSLFFNKVADLRPATLLKRDPGTGVFLCMNFATSLRIPFLQNNSG